MGRIGDLFALSDVGYPGQPGTDVGGRNGGSYSPPARSGFFNQFFAPADLPYPLPAFLGGTRGVATEASVALTSQPAPASCAPSPAATTPAAPAPVATPAAPASPAPSVPTPSAPAVSTPAPTPTAAPAPSVSPVTVIVQPWSAPACSTADSTSVGGSGGSATASSGGSAKAPTTGGGSSSRGGLSADMPVSNCPVPPTEQIVSAFATNPRLRARRARAEEVVVDEMLDGKIALRMLSKDSAPVAFVVPDGCDAVDFTFGAIEANPGHGNAQDLDEVVTAGAPVVSGITNGALLTPGDQITVVVPWRYGSWVELAADHLRLPIVARFYLIETA